MLCGGKAWKAEVNWGGCEVSSHVQAEGSGLGMVRLTRIRSRCLHKGEWLGPRADNRRPAIATVASRPSKKESLFSHLVVFPCELSPHPPKDPSPTRLSTRCVAFFFLFLFN